MIFVQWVFFTLFIMYMQWHYVNRGFALTSVCLHGSRSQAVCSRIPGQALCLSWFLSTTCQLAVPQSNMSRTLLYLNEFNLSHKPQICCSSWETWTADNHMQVNSAKTKEMIIDPHFSLPLRVPQNAPLSYQEFMLNFPCVGQSTLTAQLKAATRFYFLKQLKRVDYPAVICYTTVPQLYDQFQNTVFLSGTMLSQKIEVNKLREYQNVPLTSYFFTRGMPYIFMLYSVNIETCLLYTSPSPRDRQKSRMPSSA